MVHINSKFMKSLKFTLLALCALAGYNLAAAATYYDDQDPFSETQKIYGLSGLGTTDNPILIGYSAQTEYEWNLLCDYVNGGGSHYENEHDCSDLEIAIYGDISVSAGTTLEVLKYFNGHMYGNYNDAETHDIGGMGPDFDDTDYFPDGNDTKYFGMLFCTIGPDGLVENITVSKEKASSFDMSGTGTVYPVSVGIVGRLQGTLKNVSSDRTHYYYGNQVMYYYGETQVQYLGGLVGWVDGGKMEDCVFDYHTYFKNEEILNNTSDSELKLEYVGGIAGYVSNGGIITNCSFGNADDFADDSSDCSEAWMWGSCYTGGIVGLLDGGTIDNCYSYGTVICKSDNSEYSVGAAGGVVGLLKSGLVSNCTSNNANRGMTDEEDGDGEGWWYNPWYGRVDTWNINGIVTPGYAGGIVGEINASSLLSGTNGDKPTALVSGCTVNSSTLIYVGDYSDWTYPSDDDTTFDRSSYAGGIVGKSTNGTIVDCVNYAAIEGVTYLGGVAGSLEGSNTLTGNINYGSVTSTNTETLSLTDADGEELSGVFSFTGGIAGTTIYSSTNTYNYTFDGCTNYGTVTVGSGSERVGGIVSEIFADINDDGSYNSSITNCTNYGTITGADMIAGGIVGVAQSLYIDNCTNGSAEYNDETYYGSVTTSGTGEASAGGIVGKAQRYTSISNCSNSATISAQGQYVGGIAGSLISYSTLSSSSNSGSISGGLSSGVTEAYVGGVVGSANGESGAVSVTSCSNSGSVTTNGAYLGGITGRLNYASATECSNTGAITSSYSSGSYMGGIVGIAESSSTISNCSNLGSLTGYGYTGGINGYANASSIENCTNSATISATQYVGGISGYAKNTMSISSCFNYGDIKGTYTSYTRVGGIAGYAYSGVTLSNCYSNGAVSGPNYIGGIVGQAYGYYSTSNNEYYPITISNCKNEGLVTATYTSTGCVGGVAGNAYYAPISNSGNTGAISGAYQYTGGIVGKALGIADSYLSLNNCINTGSVSGSDSYTGGICGNVQYGDVDNVYNSGVISGTDYVGGIAGYCYGTSSTNNTIDGSINYGSVSGTSTCVGGIAGYMSYTSIGTTYNTGDINASSNYAGGIVGYVSSTSTLSEAFNTGAVSCSGNYAGGLAGAFNGTISYCYNNSPVSGVSYVGGLVGSLPGSSDYYSLSINCAYTSDSISASSTPVGPIIGQEVTSSSTDVTLKKVYYLKYDSYYTSDMVSNYATDDDGGEISAFEYLGLVEYKIDDTYFTLPDSYSYPVLTSLSDNDYALAYAAAVVPYVDETIAEERGLSSADTYDAITDWCYLGGLSSSVTWNTDSPFEITNNKELYYKYGEVSDYLTSHVDEWETTGYVYISNYTDYWRADFKITNGVSVILYATSGSYIEALTTDDDSGESDESTESNESDDIAAAAAVREEASDSTPSTITTLTTTAVSVPTKLTFATYSNSVSSSDDDDSDSDSNGDSDSDSNSNSSGGYTDSEGNGFTSSIDSAQSNDATIISEQYYTTSGVRVNEPTDGTKAIYIVVRQLSDGTTQTAKVIK